MGIDAVNEQRSSGSMVPVVLSAGAGAFIGGKLKGAPITAPYIMKKDTFELSKKAQEKASDAEKAAVNNINDLLKGTNSEAVTAKVNQYFKTPEATEIPASEYMHVEKIQAEVDEAKKGLSALEKNVTEAADDAAKKTATELLEAQKSLISAGESKLALVKDGKITKEALTSHITAELKSGVEPKIAEQIKAFGENLPKIFSAKKAVIGGLIGLVAGVIVSKLTASKPEAPES